MKGQWKVVQQAPMIQARVLNALRETQLEHGKVLKEHSEAIAGLRIDFAGLRTEFGELRTEFGELRTEFGEFRDEVRLGFAGIARSLDFLIDPKGQTSS